jgi:hypothetical protein
MTDIHHIEDEIRAKGNLVLAAEGNGLCKGLFGRAELARFIELTVIGQIGLDSYSKDPPPVENDPAVEQARVDLQWGTDDEYAIESSSFAADLMDGIENPVQ